MTLSYSSINTRISIEQFEAEKHSPLIVFHADDAWRNTPIQFKPLILKADDYELPEAEPKIFEEDLEVIRHGLVYVRVYNTKNKPAIKVLGELDNTEGFENKTVFLSDDEFDFQSNYKFQGSKGRYGKPQEERQKHHGVFEERHRETLRFNGDTEQTISLGIDYPEIAIAEFSQFFNAAGKSVSKSHYPENKTPGARRAPFSYSKQPYPDQNGFYRFAFRGNTFYAPYPMFGVVVVEYMVEYHLFSILYDVKEPKRVFEVKEGTEVKTGKKVTDAEGVEIAADTETTDKSFQKISLKGWKKDEQNGRLEFFVFDKGQGEFASYNYPEPDFNDFTAEEMPRKRIYKEVKRYKVYPDGAASGNQFIESDQIEKISFVDIFGKITHENVKDESKQGVASGSTTA